MKKHILIPMGMIVAVIVATAGCGPIGPTPGLVIGGEEQPPPADFEFVREHDLILIRTYFGGWLPQVHNIWGVGVAGGIYSTAIPGARWRARLNDDPNGLLRQYFPKGMDLSTVHQNRLNAVARRLNERPRETLDFQTPAERFSQCVASTG